jgi:hypothetical protein
VNSLTADTEALSKQVSTLSTEKRRLEEEMLYLHSIIKQSPELSAALETRRSTSILLTNKNVKAAGVCLLIVLFSFGLLFNTTDPNHPFSSIVKKSSSAESHIYVGRVLQGLDTKSEDVQVNSIPQIQLNNNDDGDMMEDEEIPRTTTKRTSTTSKQYASSSTRTSRVSE